MELIRLPRFRASTYTYSQVVPEFARPIRILIFFINVADLIHPAKLFESTSVMNDPLGAGEEGQGLSLKRFKTENEALRSNTKIDASGGGSPNIIL
jgi:hypothetical protein